MIIFGFGDSIFGPAFNGSISKSSSSNQGKIHGASQALQSLSRIIGPILGGIFYVYLGHFSPFLICVIFLLLSIFI